MSTPTLSSQSVDRRISIAPMMQWTDRHFRYLLRLLSKHILLYTEMVHTGALLHGDKARFLRFDPCENPLALQLGGSEPQALAKSAQLAEMWGYDEVNLNVGCPSDRVQAGEFGACLMARPQLVADCVQAMREAVSIPVTVKTRIGIDDRDSFAELLEFIASVRRAGCEVFIIHARKAWLQGLSPKENREIPPLRYQWVYDLKRAFPELCFILNGGLIDLEQISEHVQGLDGVMIGREAYQNPYVLAGLEQRFYHSEQASLSRVELIQHYLPYVQQQLAEGVYLKHMAKHLLNVFQGQPGAKLWRRRLSERMHAPDAGIEVLQGGLKLLEGYHV